MYVCACLYVCVSVGDHLSWGVGCMFVWFMNVYLWLWVYVAVDLLATHLQRGKVCSTRIRQEWHARVYLWSVYGCAHGAVSVGGCGRGVCMSRGVSWSRCESECISPCVCNSVCVCACVCACLQGCGRGCKASMYSCADCALHNSRGHHSESRQCE